MLREIHAQSFAYDAATDTARLHAPGAQGTGRLALLDAAGFLVGVDLRGDDPRGTIVMMGPHEAVASTREIGARVDGDDVVIASAKKEIRGAEKNPYG